MEKIDISTRNNPQEILWEGPGWYAPRQESPSGYQHTRWYQVDSTDPWEDARNSVLGTPFWFNTPTPDGQLWEPG